MAPKGIDWNLEGYKKEAHFFLCGAFESFDFIKDFVKIITEYPSILKENTFIDSVYGSPTCIWNGGRTLTDFFYNKHKLEIIRDTYAELGVTVRFVFTNPLLNEYDLHDRYCNLVMDIFKDISPEIVIRSPLLEEYLRDKYPSASFISSTTKRLRSSAAQLKEFDHDYKYVCLDYDYNHDEEFLNSVPIEYRPRVEILANPDCQRKCEARIRHDIFASKRQLEFGDKYTDPFQLDCPLLKRTFEIPFEKRGSTREYLKSTNYIFPQDLDWYLDNGFCHFKLQDRDLPANALFAAVFPYLIRPQYYQTLISFLKWS